MRDRKNDAHTKNLPIKPGQIRHHRDGNKQNNAKDNLEVQTRSAHTTYHNKHRTLGRLRKALTMASRGEKSY